MADRLEQKEVLVVLDGVFLSDKGSVCRNGMSRLCQREIRIENAVIELRKRVILD